MSDEEKGEKAPEIVLKVHIHCEGCASKLARFLKRIEGVEDVSIDLKTSKVVVKGKVEDPIKFSQSLQKKCGKNVELVSPASKPSESDEPHFQQPPKQEKKEVKKDEAPPPPPAEVMTVALKIQMHCEACAQALRKRIRKIQGVESVETKLGSSEVVVKGVVEPVKLVEDIYKKTRKQASVIVKKEEDKKEGIREEENKEEGDKEMKSETKPNQYWPSVNYSEYANYNYPPPPHFFSDENPNACTLM